METENLEAEYNARAEALREKYRQLRVIESEIADGVLLQDRLLVKMAVARANRQAAMEVELCH